MKVMLVFSFFKYKMKLKYWLFFFGGGGDTYAPTEVLIGLGGGVEGALLSISAARMRL